MLDLSSLLILGSFQKTVSNNSSRGPFNPLSLQCSTVDNSGSHTVRPFKFACGGGGQHIFPLELIHPHIIAGSNVCHDHAFKFIDHVDSIGQAAYPVQQDFIHAKVPLGDILPYLPLKLGRKIARLHHIAIGSHVSKSEFIHYFENHDCVSCNLYSSVFAVVNSKAAKDRLRKRLGIIKLNNINSTETLLKEDHSSKKDNTDCCRMTLTRGQAVNDSQNGLDKVHTVDTIIQVEPVSPINPIVESVEFPPTPLENTLSQRIISDFCEQSSPSALEEAGCAVCGKLCHLN